MLVNNKLGALNSSPPGAGGVARSAEGVEIIFKVQCYGNAGRRYENLNIQCPWLSDIMCNLGYNPQNEKMTFPLFNF